MRGAAGTMRLKRLPDARALARRRRRLMSRMGSRDVVLLSSAPETFHSNDVEHRYRPDSDLFYLTGFSEPGAVAVLAPGHPHGDFWLVVRPRDPGKEAWTGPRAGVQGAREIYGARMARPLAALPEVVEEVLDRAATLYHMPGRDPALDTLLRRLLSRRRRNRRRIPRTLSDVRPLVHEMRLKKEQDELAHMRRAAAITCRAHREGMALAAPGLYEYQVEARIDCVFRTLGAQGVAYPTIVGSGPNGVILHHVDNQRRMRRGDLVLVDAGCEFHCYAADVTRTFPVDGRFRPPQRRLYDLVLAAQQAAMGEVRAGVSMDRPHQAAVEVLAQGLVDLGILPGTPRDVVAGKTYLPFFMHRTSHWLGLDVHDVGGRTRHGRPRRLASGMVLTVEPGLYIRADAAGVPAAYRGLGIRIEDDLLVTAAGHEVLTGDLPRTAAAIERACRRAPRL